MDGPVDVVLDYPSHVLLLAQEELVALKDAFGRRGLNSLLTNLLVQDPKPLNPNGPKH